MGQFGNQPDFGTQTQFLEPYGDAIDMASGYHINPPCALYVGTGGDLLVTVVGGDLNSQYGDNTTLFKNMPTGTFMPIMVSYVWRDYDGTTLTTAGDLIGVY